LGFGRQTYVCQMVGKQRRETGEFVSSPVLFYEYSFFRLVKYNDIITKYAVDYSDSRFAFFNYSS